MYAMLTGELPFHVEPINMTVLHAQILLGAKIPDTLSESETIITAIFLNARLNMTGIFSH